MGTIELQRFVILMFTAFLAFSAHQPTAMKSGFLEGRVTVGPLRPGPVRADEQEPAPPPELFASHRILILAADRRKVKEVAIDARGYFKTELPPGDYLVSLTPNDIGMRKQPPSAVTVVSGKTATLNLDIDTGMR